MNTTRCNILKLAGVSLLALFVSAATDKTAPEPVSVIAGNVTGVVNPLFFGVNTLFMIDDDAALADGRIVEHLRAMPCRLMRFPGGDVADNYHWKAHTLDNPNWWPNESGPQTTDTDEFMAFCRKVGAEPIFVVDLESGFVRGDIASTAREAAEWVAYCKQKGYRVRFWEIGNETYLYNPGQPPEHHKHKRIRITAAEYGRIFQQVTQAMKAVDPGALCGAVGPGSVTTSNNNRLPNGGKANPPEPPWWPTVLKTVGAKPDFLVVHEYFGRKLTPELFARKGLDNGRELPELKHFAQQALGRLVPLALTEWNLNKEFSIRGIVAAQIQAEMLCRYLNTGVDWATFWPLRLKGQSFRSVLDLKTNQPLSSWQVLHFFAANAIGNIVQTEHTLPALFSFATLGDNPRTLSVFLINKATPGADRTITLNIKGFQATTARGQWLAAVTPESDELRQLPLEVSRQENHWTCRLPAHALALVKFRQ